MTMRRRKALSGWPRRRGGASSKTCRRRRTCTCVGRRCLPVALALTAHLALTAVAASSLPSRRRCRGRPSHDQRFTPLLIPLLSPNTSLEENELQQRELREDQSLALKRALQRAEAAEQTSRIRADALQGEVAERDERIELLESSLRQHAHKIEAMERQGGSLVAQYQARLAETREEWGDAFGAVERRQQELDAENAECRSRLEAARRGGAAGAAGAKAEIGALERQLAESAERGDALQRTLRAERTLCEKYKVKEVLLRNKMA